MELREFIKSVLVEISQGVVDGQEEVRSIGGFVNPRFCRTNDVSKYYNDDSECIVEGIKFELSVGNSKEKNKKGMLSINVLSGGISSNTMETALNKITFVIPLQLPSFKYKDHD